MRRVIRRRWTVLTVFAVVVLSAVVYAFTATPIYEARVRLLLELEDPNVVQFQQVMSEQPRSTKEFYETQHELLRSRSLVRKTLDRLELWRDPVFLGMETGATPGPAKFFHGIVDTALSVAVGAVRLVLLRPTPSRSSVWDHDDTQEEITRDDSRAIDVFLRGFSAHTVGDSRLLELAYRSPHPRLAAEVVNIHANAYIDHARELRFQQSVDATAWLREQLEEQRQLVEASEAALHQYRQDHDAISFEDREDIVVQRLTALNAALTRARTDAIAREVADRQLADLADDPTAIDSHPAVVSNSFIQEIRAEVADLRRQRATLNETLGPRHPEMIHLESAVSVAETRLQVEINKVLEAVHNEFLAAQAQVRSLARELDGQKAAALAMSEVGIAYGVLVRDAESNREIYGSLLQRAKETGVTAELQNNNIRVVDPAEAPRSPIRPNKGFILIVALLTGGVLGIGSALFIEYLDDRIKSPDELGTHLGLLSLGLIPSVPAKSRTPGQPASIDDGAPPNFAEAFRTVRTAVLFSPTDRKRSLVVTSTGPSEGKSLVATNLAIGLAQAEQRVLLVDGDMRRPRIHTAFGQRQEPGLSNLLIGASKLEDVIRETTVPGLHVITAGTVPPNPSELLGSQAFRTLVDSWPSQFDWVLIDSPPAMAVTDAAVVANVAGAVLFVVGADMTSRRAAQQALDRIDAAGGRFLGAVLNRVDLHRNAYYYSPYYRGQYEQYYTQGSSAGPSALVPDIPLPAGLHYGESLHGSVARRSAEQV